MDELEQLRQENAALRAQIGSKEPAGLWPANYPKFRVIRKGEGRGDLVSNAFVLLPLKHDRDRDTLLHYAGLCRADGDIQLADDIEAWCSPKDTLPTPA